MESRALLPFTFLKSLSGPAGRNWPGVVIIDKQHPFRAAIWAQEAWESRYKLNPVNLLMSLTTDGKRKLELMGHEVEVQAAGAVYAVDEDAYRIDEADRMITGYPKLFGKMTRLQVVSAMRNNSADASDWVRDNLREIRRYK